MDLLKRRKIMAHLEKYTKGQLPHLLKHDERAKDENGEYIRFGNKSIDTTKTHLNYNLHERNDGLSDYEYILSRGRQYLAKNVVNREDVNWVGSWVVTLPEALKNAPADVQKKFFKSTTAFMENRYGHDNIVGAYVHNDETTPHVHFKVTPVFFDRQKRKWRFSAKEMFDKTDLKTFHADLSKHLEREFGYDVGVYNENSKAKGKVPNKSIQELKRETLDMADLKQKVSDDVHKKSEELKKLNDKKKLIQEEMESGSVLDKLKKKLVEKDVNKTLEIAEKLTKERTVELENRANEAMDLVRGIREQKNEVLEKNKKFAEAHKRLKQENENLKQENEYLKQENGLLNKALNTLQRAFDIAEEFLKNIGFWKSFKFNRFKQENDELYKEFQSVRHDETLHGTRHKENEIGRDRGYFDMEI